MEFFRLFPSAPLFDFVCTVAAPPDIVTAPFHPIMKRRMRPISRCRNEIVFDGIKMDIIHVMLKIGGISDGVFPIAALPYGLLAFRHPAGGPRAFTELADVPAREGFFDQAPTR